MLDSLTTKPSRVTGSSVLVRESLWTLNLEPGTFDVESTIVPTWAYHNKRLACSIETTTVVVLHHISSTSLWSSLGLAWPHWYSRHISNPIPSIRRKLSWPRRPYSEWRWHRPYPRPFTPTLRLSQPSSNTYTSLPYYSPLSQCLLPSESSPDHNVFYKIHWTSLRHPWIFRWFLWQIPLMDEHCSILPCC